MYIKKNEPNKFVKINGWGDKKEAIEIIKKYTKSSL